MILFLLKSRGLRVHLFVGLLLVLGIIPERSEGLQCYSCMVKREGDELVCDETIVTCDPDETVCIKLAVSGYVGLKSCGHEVIGKCLADVGYADNGEQCGVIPGEDFKGPKGKSPYEKKMLACANKYLGRTESFRSLEGLKGRSDDEDDDTGIQCVCDTELCNDTRQQQTSNSKLVFAILITAAFYNYNYN